MIFDYGKHTMKSLFIFELIKKSSDLNFNEVELADVNFNEANKLKVFSDIEIQKPKSLVQLIYFLN